MKKSLGLVLLIIIFVLVGCDKLYIEKENVVDREIAINKVNQYMIRLQKGDLEGANEIVSKGIVSKIKINTEDLPILSFGVTDDIRSNDGIWVLVNVVRGKADEASCSLDKWFLQVKESENEDYKITEIKGKTEKEIFTTGNDLNILTAEDAQSNVIVTLQDLPKKVYVKSDKVQINDLKMPLNKFDKIGTSMDGNFVAFSTTDGKNSFIGVAFMENAKPAFSSNVLAAGPPSSITEGDLKKDFGLPIAKKIAYFDLLENTKIQKLMFSEDANALVVQYIGKEDTPQINVYSLPDGDLVSLNLEEIFPPDRYTVEYVISIKADLLVFVNKKPGVNGIYQEVLGEYIIDLKNKTIDKI